MLAQIHADCDVALDAIEALRFNVERTRHLAIVAYFEGLDAARHAAAIGFHRAQAVECERLAGNLRGSTPEPANGPSNVEAGGLDERQAARGS